MGKGSFIILLNKQTQCWRKAGLQNHHTWITKVKINVLNTRENSEISSKQNCVTMSLGQVWVNKSVMEISIDNSSKCSK